jgi:drug/metabolite transporter (DMT)-like permease
MVLAAAVLHASWNALAHALTDKLAGFVVINVAVTACAAVLVAVSPMPAAGSWPFIVASTVLEVLYQCLLLQAYRLGEFGQIYPLARGTSPWVVALIAVTILGQALPPRELVGVLVISAGLIGLTFAGGMPRRAHLPALAAAFGTGVMIALYTVTDGLGVRQSGTVAGYVGWVFLLQGPAIPLLALALHGRSLRARLAPVWGRGLIGGVLSIIAYGLVVWAQSRGTLASVAALRETSIVIATVLGTVLFHERFGRARFAASALVVAGIIILKAGTT